METVVSEKGQITIPKLLRNRLGLDCGAILDFEEREGVLMGRKRTGQDVIGKWRGKGRLPARLSVDGYLREVRDYFRGLRIVSE